MCWIYRKDRGNVRQLRLWKGRTGLCPLRQTQWKDRLYDPNKILFNHLGAEMMQSILAALWAGQLENQYSIPGRGADIFLFSEAFRPILILTQAPIQSMLGCCSPGVKWQKSEAD
jgi:hypothetical protein